MRSRYFLLGAICAAMLPGLAAAAERRQVGEFNPENQTVEFFQAMKDGKLDVKFIPQNAQAANILIENKTDKPLNVRLPDAFAGVPVLAQFGGPQQQQGGGGSGAQGLGGGGGNGGGNQQGGGNPFNFGGGQGMFNVSPEKVGIVKVDTVCLDHGKPDPTPRMEYKIVPAEEYVQKPEVIELLKLLGQGKLDQDAAQAAAWHLNNGKSWEELAKMRIFSRRYVGGSKPYFQRNTLQLGYKIAEHSKKISSEAGTESAGSISESPGHVTATPVRR